jgi:ankyrin repeat protein
MRAALKVLNDSVSSNNVRSSNQITSAVNIIQQEWFKTSSTKQSNPLDVEDYLDAIEEMSRGLLDRVVNLTDVNGNTALHYSVSHGNFDVVSILLDSKVGNANILNKAGYTCIMLISLAPILNDIHRAVVCRLFSMGDVNIRATQHGQTALMLAASHGRLDMVQLLVGAGADINIRDEDGSTALMCAAEHGHSGIVKYLLQNPDTDVLAKDNDGLTALAVAMEAGHRDLGVLLYANTSLSRGASPYSSVRIKKPQSTSTSHSRTASPSTSNRTPTSRTLIPVPSTGTPKAPTTPTPPQRTRRNSLNQ